MNAIIILSHFCEIHGPSIVFCTQSFQDPVSLQDIFYNVKPREQKESPTQFHQRYPQWKYGSVKCETRPPLNTPWGRELCAACRSFDHNQPGFVSNDDEIHISYVSAQYPQQRGLYSIVKPACFRSLSVEVCPSKEGPIYFGDRKHGHVISYFFFLKDSQARGFRRSYSISILMNDKFFLLKSWKFLVRHLRKTVDKLQDCAAKVFSKEEELVNLRAQRVSVSLRRQAGCGQPKSLPDLLNDPKVWEKLHHSFTWLMKACTLRLSTRTLQGQPLLSPVIFDKDVLSVQVVFKILGVDTFSKVLHHLYVGHKLIIFGCETLLISHFIKALKPLLPKYMYHPVFYCMDYGSCNNCNIVALQTYSELPDKVLKEGCIVIEVTPKSDVCESKESLCPLPSHSHSSVGEGGNIHLSQDYISFQSQHEDVLKDAVEICCEPNDSVEWCEAQEVCCEAQEDLEFQEDPQYKGPLLDASTARLLKSDVPSQTSEEMRLSLQQECKYVMSEISSCEFSVLNESPLDERMPLAVARLVTALQKNILKEKTLSVFFATVIEEWSNKVNIWIEMKRLSALPGKPERSAKGGSIFEEQGLLRLLGFQLPFNKRTSDKAQPPRDYQNMLQMVNARECDLPLLEAWAQFYPV